jgi:CHASE3 domain sensor protein
MTIEELAERIEEIRDLAGDDEVAHSSEDRLRHDVLVAIAAGCDNARELAALVLTTSDIEFARWCA